MAITFQYGPPADVLGLAAHTGKGLRRQNQQAADLAFIQAINAAQADQNRKRVHEIQAALVDDKLDLQASQVGADAARSAAELEFRNRQLDANIADQNADREIALKNAMTAAQNAASNDRYRQQLAEMSQQKFQAQQSAIDALPLGVRDVVRATGRLPSTGGGGTDNSMSQLRSEYSRLRADLAAAERKLAEAAFDENDFDKMLTAEPSKQVPGAVAGMEARFLDAQRTANAIRERMSSIDSALQGRTAPLVGGTPVSAQAAQEIIRTQQAPAPAQASANPPVITTAQEYAQLPLGAEYIWNGTLYRKGT